jgi:hypothetical protein
MIEIDRGDEGTLWKALKPVVFFFFSSFLLFLSLLTFGGFMVYDYFVWTELDG